MQDERFFVLTEAEGAAAEAFNTTDAKVDARRTDSAIPGVGCDLNPLSAGEKIYLADKFFIPFRVAEDTAYPADMKAYLLTKPWALIDPEQVFVVGQYYDWFVDSAEGDDQADGATKATAFATIAAVNAAVAAEPTKKRIGLKRGSYWRERLGSGSFLDGSLVGCYGTGALPVLDGADVATNADFSLATDQTNTYQISWSHSLGTYSGKEFFTVWEDGARLSRQTSIANCEANAGSFYAPNPTQGQAATIYVHPKGNTNPTSDGKVYEITRRLWGIGIPADDVTISHVRCRRGGNNNGSLDVGVNATIKDVICQEGRLHNILAGSGRFERSWSWKLEKGTGGTGWVVFTNDADGKTASFSACYHVGDTDNAASGGESGFYAHGNGGTQHASLTFDKSFVYYAGVGFDGLADQITITRCGTERVAFHIATGATWLEVDDHYFKGYDPTGVVSSGRVVSPAGAAGRIHHSRAEVMKASASQAFFYGAGSWEIDHNSLYDSGGGSYYMVWNTSTATIDFHHNVAARMSNILNGSASLTLGTWDHNVYYRSPGSQNWTLSTGNNAGLANWKTASGKEANSVSADPDFAGDPATGDFTVEAGSPAENAGATSDPDKGRWQMPDWDDVISWLEAA